MKIIQFTDLHLFASPRGRLLNVDTDASLRAILRAAQKDALWPPDLILLTGDLSQDGSAASYGRLLGAMKKLKTPVYCLPGNHDAAPLFKQSMRASNVQPARQIVRGFWNLVLLDSTIPRRNGGYFRASELSFLKKALKSYPKHHALVSCHHNPVKTGSKWLDTMTIKNAKKFLKIVDKSAVVEAVVFGHVHQVVEKRRKGVLYAASPSTCVQFKPKARTFTVDRLRPGYQWIFLGADGSVETRVRRVSVPRFKPDLHSRGY